MLLSLLGFKPILDAWQIMQVYDDHVWCVYISLPMVMCFDIPRLFNIIACVAYRAKAPLRAVREQ